MLCLTLLALSRRADFWLASGGAFVGLLAAVVVTCWRNDRELDARNFILSEFHLGATDDAILRRRLWHRWRLCCGRSGFPMKLRCRS